jgi:hypothetical protein
MLLVLYTALMATGGRESAAAAAIATQTRWELRVEDDGILSAVLTGSDPPITVSGENLASLRKQIIKTMPRRRLR